MWETIKANPWKTLTGSVITIAVSVLGFVFTDARYVHVEDQQKVIDDLKHQIEQLKSK